jgi:hypothetical protein
MDSSTQTLADDANATKSNYTCFCNELFELVEKHSSNRQTNMDSTKSDKTSADDDKVKSDLFNLAEKLQIELQVKDQELQAKDKELQGKDEELAKEKLEKQVCTIF